MPFATAGKCWGTTAEALTAWQKSFPIFGDVNWQWHNSSSISSSGLITYSISQKPTTTNTVSARTGTMQLTACSAVDETPAFDPVAAGGVFAFFFLGVAGTWYLSQNLGLILEAVKKW